MVSLWERNDEFTCPLVAPINPDTRVCQALRVHQRDKLEEKVRLSLKEVGSFLPDRCLKFLSVVARNTVPSLRLAPVH